MFSIPTELIDLLKARRVIPFVGAGFSAGHDLPNWENMLREVCLDIPDIPPFEKIHECCNGDFLQIAEYLYIKSDKSIGPLRHKLSSMLASSKQWLDSTPHVELVNLNCQQIYTTNYDEIIEKTFAALGHPCSFVALPKHIAAANRDKTQVVKYHGDLRYDHSLVLTESSYYARLEFESPMDLKFRSDLLGQSVLFIGYSFRDINIRIIWFKLMEMMRDVPEADRPSSYIVRFEKNEVLEDLYKAVGIKTIYLDPNGKLSGSSDKLKLLNRFMISLSAQTGRDGNMPGSSSLMYLSKGLIEEISSGYVPRGLRSSRLTDYTRMYLECAAGRKVPMLMLPVVDDAIGKLARSGSRPDLQPALTNWAVSVIKQAQHPYKGIYFCIIRGLFRNDTRAVIDESKDILNWQAIWELKLSVADVDIFVKIANSELRHHQEFPPDSDLAYIADVLIRIQRGYLHSDNQEASIEAVAEPLRIASELYPSIEEHSPNKTGLSDLTAIIAEIQKAAGDEALDDNIPF